VGPLRRATPKRKGKRALGKNKNKPGTLRKSTGVVQRKYKGGALQAAYVGHRWPKGAAAHLVDAGTKQRQTKRGLNRGMVAPRRFFNSAIDPHRQQVMETMRRELEAGIEAAANKAALESLKKFVNKNP
jgi:hypothetical protein